MYINKQDKVFSLRRTSGVVMRSNLASMWGELYAYLLVAGFYHESASGSCATNDAAMTSRDFMMPGTAYHCKIGTLIAKGLYDRVSAIMAHPRSTEDHKEILTRLASVFRPRSAKNNTISAKRLYNVAVNLGVADDMKALAHYASVMYGDHDFLPDTTLPFLYINVFGNIYLSGRYSVIVKAPSMICGRVVEDTQLKASPLFAFLSSFVESIDDDVDPYSSEAMENGVHPSFNPSELVGHYLILGGDSNYSPKTEYITIPRAAMMLTWAGDLGVLDIPPADISSVFYHRLVFGTSSKVSVINAPLFARIVDVMVIKSSDRPNPTELENDVTEILKRNSCSYRRGYDRGIPVSLSYALEALEAEDADKKPDEEPEDKTDASDDETSDDADISNSDGLEEPEKDPEQDPSTADNSYDPAVPPPAVPASGPGVKENTIGLISFDKTGDGVDADFYRSAVVELNDRIQNDSSVPVDTETKEALNQWVNQFLYRTAIGVTVDRMTSLGLQNYIKVVSVKG